jgi:cell division protein FtsB
MNKLGKFPKIWTWIFLVLVFGYLVFIFSKTVWKNYNINQQIFTLQKETDVLQQENLQLKNLVVYYQSDSYKEREARLLLNYKAPGEKVVAFPLNIQQTDDFKFQETTNVDTRSNPQKWFDFILHKS